MMITQPGTQDTQPQPDGADLQPLAVSDEELGTPNMIVPPPITHRISLVPDPNIRRLDDVLSAVFHQYGLERLGGASGRGWSSHATFQKCPYYFKLRMLDGHRGNPSAALETGSAFHTFMALHYTWMVDENLQLSPEVMKQALLDGGANVESVLGAWRIYQNYVDYYESDYIYPLGVEQWAEDPDGNTCRYDLIARIDTAQAGVVPGTWIVEHKTASRFDAASIDGWRNDGEILGQIMVWKRAKLDKKYGKLRGVIVNIAGKQKTPQFHRTIVPAQAWHVRQHTDDLKVWSAIQRVCEATGTWPRSRANCITRYGLCEMFDLCAENRKPNSNGHSHD
jgi:hypothetical protein